MDIGIGTCFSTKKYEYTITERDNLGFFIASVKIRGQLGKIDTGVTVRIVMENESSGIDMNALMRSAALFEAFRINNVLCCAMKDDADTVEASVVDDDPKVANGASGGSKAYYEEPSATANELSENCGRQGFMARMWKKTWRLWAALLCFLMIPVMIWLLLDFFSGNGGTHIRVGAILAPIYLLYIGVKLLVGFVDDLSGDNQKG